MNIQEYIASGILEQYVLGLTSAAETREVEEYADEYPEIKSELERLRLAVEKYATLHAVTPDPALKSRILGNLDGPVGGQINSNSGGVPKGWLWLLGFALVAALAGLFLMRSSVKDTEAQLQSVQATLDQLQIDCTADRSQLALLQSQLAVIRDQGTQAVRLDGTQLSPQSTVHVYWNPDLQSSYLNVVNLPTPPSDRQYQLWALVDGTPVDMGVITIDPTLDTLTEVPFVANAGAFAITLEPVGGSAGPTLDQMYVIGNVSTG